MHPTKNAAAHLTTTDENRLFSATSVAAECFWGDYRLEPAEILARLDRQEQGFDRFLFSKIIENCRLPSRHLSSLFPPAKLCNLLERYQQAAGNKKRVRLIVANLTGRHDLVPELQWQK